MDMKLGMIGAGNMAEAIVRAAIDHGVVPAEQIIAADPSEDRRALFASLGVTTTEDNAAVIEASEQVLLAIKPQTLPSIAAHLASTGKPSQIVMSIMAGIGSDKLEQAAGRPLRVVRVMPNTPLLVGRGMAGIALGKPAQPGDDALAMSLFSAGDSEAIRVDEAMMDAVSAVSGSGPAYLFYLAEAREKAAAGMGLGEHAQLLGAQTLCGESALLMQSEDSAAELRRKVTSPGGTTEAAINHMHENKLLNTVVDALRAAEARGKALGQSS